MGFLSGIGGWLIQQLLKFITGLISKVIENVSRRKEITAEAQRQAEEDAKKASAITPTSSEKEIDDAINDISKHS